MLQTSFHLLPFGRIEHQGDFDVRNQPRGQLVHVVLAVAPDEINVDVKHVRAFAFLFPRERYQAVPVFGIQQVAHPPGAAGVHSLANDEKRRVLTIGLLNEDRRTCRGSGDTALQRCNVFDCFDDCF